MEIYLIVILGIIVLLPLVLICVGNSIERKELENRALQEIKVGMKKNQVDVLLGESVLEKTTKTYVQYRYLVTTKTNNVSYSMNWNLKGGRTYYQNRKSYISIKFSYDTLEVIEIINKL